MTQLALLDVDPAARRAFDFYETPVWQTTALLTRVPIAGSVLEPCAGDGAIVNVLRHARGVSSIDTNDLDLRRKARRHLDASNPAAWRQFKAADWVVSNPPFNAANAIVPLACQHARLGVAMLLRLSWLEPTEARGDFLRRNPPALIVLSRHSYRDNGQTDSVTSAWFLWTVGEGAKRFGRFPNDIVTREERDRLIAEARRQGEF